MAESTTYATENLRTVALVGHGAAGKTTLAEQLLAKSGMIGAPGSVERGTTVSDYDPQEKAALHSLRSSILHCDYNGVRIHLIDTPGYPDFIGQSIGALDAVETAAVVVSATGGIELVTRRMMDWAKSRNLCRMIIVNKIDHEHIDLPALLERLREAFGPEVLPINLPAGGGSRVIDCFDHDTGEADFLSVAEVHRQVMEQIVEVDDAAMEKYLEEGAIDPSTLHAPLEKALREGHIIPVCFVSARTGAGVQDLLDVMVRHLPHPGEGNPPLFYRGEGEAAREFRSEPDPKKHVLAHVFKVEIDPFIGKLGVFRIHQGTVTPNTQLYVGEARKPFKVSHLYRLLGKTHIEVSEGLPGDICAVAKIEELHFDAVLHDSHDEDHYHLKSIAFPPPMLGVAIEPRTKADQDKMDMALRRLADEEDVHLILTTGGTGPAPRDHTPEATKAVIEREMPGLAELLRQDGQRRTPWAVLSRGVAGIRGRTLIINLPGNPRAVREGLEVLAPLLPPTVSLMRGGPFRPDMTAAECCEEA